MSDLETVTSSDGTPIAFERSGTGPPLVLVAGTLGTRNEFGELATLLAERFTVVNYDRRGRGASGDRQPYAVECEIEDIAALIERIGGTAFVYGASSGAKLALLAACAMPDRMLKLALHEPPFMVDATGTPLPADYVEQLETMIERGRRDAALEYFFRVVLHLPDDEIAAVRLSSDWERLLGMAQTLTYDGRIMHDTMRGEQMDVSRWARNTVPTLVMDSSDSEPFYHVGALALVDALPHARHHTFVGQTHAVAPDVLAPLLERFFLGDSDGAQ